VIVVCLDLEGVLVPEIWVEVARRTGVDALTRTTRDEPDYDKLMRYRLEILAREKLRLADIEAVIADMGPLEGAAEFLDGLRESRSGSSDLAPGHVPSGLGLVNLLPRDRLFSDERPHPFHVTARLVLHSPGLVDGGTSA